MSGKVYEFGKDSSYEIDGAGYAESTSDNTYGNFTVNGNIESVSPINGVKAFHVKDGEISLTYAYGNTLLYAPETDWHLYADKEKKVNGINLGGQLGKGALIVQSSRDRLNWRNEFIDTNVFEDVPVNPNPQYTSENIQLINGCYYRVIIAYQTRIKLDPDKYWFIEINKFDYKKHAEVYEFYAYTGELEEPKNTYVICDKYVRAAEFDGYYGSEPMKSDDPHSGWELGHFIVSGHTDKRKEETDQPVFLKNPDDKVTLWFHLNQNIDMITGNDALKVTADEKAWDKELQIPGRDGRIDFGRGALFIIYRDHNNVASDPIIYTNFLEANACAGADTKISLFEEGDYEVVLDYEITDTKFIDTVGHYRMHFKFSVRNGNCMAYPFDIENGSELHNSAFTENGFRLDLARSRYLEVLIKREVLNETVDGLVEDIRYNRPAADGDEYTEEGIYTITVKNKYTGADTVKRIYVGTNSVMKAHVVTGYSIASINEMLASGATINEDGYIINLSDTQGGTMDPVNTESPENTEAAGDDAEGGNTVFQIIGIVAALLAVAALATSYIIYRRRALENNAGGDHS